MYIDDIKTFAKNEKEMCTLIQMIRIYSQDIRMEFGIEKCVMLMMKSRKKEKEELEMLNQKSISKKNYKYFGILEVDSIKQTGMKKNKKKVLLASCCPVIERLKKETESRNS